MGQSYVFFSDTVKGDAGRPRVEPAHFQGRTRRFEKGRAAKALSAPSIGTPLIKGQSPGHPPELYYFLAQTFFLGGTSPQRTRSMGRGRSKCPAYHPPTPYTLSPLLKGGEGRGEGGSHTHVPCPFGALLVTLYHLKSKAFLMCGGGGHARLRGERQPHLTLPSYMQKPFGRNWYKRHSGN